MTKSQSTMPKKSTKTQTSSSHSTSNAKLMLSLADWKKRFQFHWVPCQAHLTRHFVSCPKCAELRQLSIVTRAVVVSLLLVVELSSNSSITWTTMRVVGLLDSIESSSLIASEWWREGSLRWILWIIGEILGLEIKLICLTSTRQLTWRSKGQKAAVATLGT